MPALRGLTVSVGQWYADLLAITLVRNMRHLVECVVVTAPDDPAIAVATQVPGVRVSVTDAFTRPDANGVRPRFNKGLAIEESGFDFMGRQGWIVIWDSDCLFPDLIPFANLREGFLNGARRRMLEDPAQWHPGLDWSQCQRLRDGGAIGFFQCVHADDPAIKDKRPWYDVSFGHAGGGDAFFMSHWPLHKHNVMPMECLHLGPTDRHWFGTDPEGIDMMARYVHENRWVRAMARHSPESAARAPEPVRRVQVPGYPVSDYHLPFERRAIERRERGEH